MTIMTDKFNRHRKLGLVKKAGKARFSNGTQALERTLWHDESDHTNYVIVNKEAYVFHYWTHDDEALYGFI